MAGATSVIAMPLQTLQADHNASRIVSHRTGPRVLAALPTEGLWPNGGWRDGGRDG